MLLDEFYGPDESVTVRVDVYVPAKAPPGIVTEMAGASVYTPIPVLAAVPKNMTAEGGVTAAGTTTGGVTPLVKVSWEQLPAVVQVAVMLVIVEAVVGRVRALPEVAY